MWRPTPRLATAMCLGCNAEHPIADKTFHPGQGPATPVYGWHPCPDGRYGCVYITTLGAKAEPLNCRPRIPCWRHESVGSGPGVATIFVPDMTPVGVVNTVSWGEDRAGADTITFDLVSSGMLARADRPPRDQMLVRRSFLDRSRRSGRGITFSNRAELVAALASPMPRDGQLFCGAEVIAVDGEFAGALRAAPDSTRTAIGAGVALLEAGEDL